MAASRAEGTLVEPLLHGPSDLHSALPFERRMDYTPAVTEDSQLRRHLPGLLLLLSIGIAVGFFLIWPPDREARTLFFPGNTDSALSGERRLVPRSSDRNRELGNSARPTCASQDENFKPGNC